MAGLLAFTFAQAAPGGLDTSYGAGGFVRAAGIPSNDRATAVLPLPDGRVVAAGTSYNADNSDFALVRYLSNGAVDTTFGTSGRVVTDIGGHDDMPTALALQPDGKLLVAGRYGADWTSPYNAFPYGGYWRAQVVIARYTTSGALDTTFGDGGIVRASLGTYASSANAIALQADGKIVIAGSYANDTNNENFLAARYTAAGVLDASFGTGGVVAMDLGNTNDRATSVAVAADGKIVVAGVGGGSIQLLRLDANGAADGTFGTTGRVSTYRAGYSLANYLALQPDGKILVAGSAGDTGTIQVGLTRYLQDGALDAAFGTGGKAGVSLSSSFGAADYATGIALQADGRILLSGTTDSGSNYGLVRVDGNGSLDPSYGSSGKVQLSTMISGFGVANSVGLASDGKAVLAGQATGDTPEFVVWRFNTAGAADATFGSFGSVYTDIGNGSPGGWSSVYARPGGGTLAVGMVTLGRQMLVLGANLASGAPDPAFGTNGIVITSVLPSQPYYQSSLWASALQADGKLLVLGTSYQSNAAYASEITLLRYGTNGALDTSFGSGSGGRVTAPFSGLTNARYLAIGPDGKIFVGAGTYDQARLYRLDASGNLDMSFGGGYVVLATETPVVQDMGGLVVQPDGKLLFRRVLQGSPSGVRISRFTAAGEPDLGFGAGGSVTIPLNSSFLTGAQLLLQPDGRIVIAYSSFNSGAGLARVTANGSPDNTFGADGIASGSGPSGPVSLALLADGRILQGGAVVIGSGPSEPGLVRWRSSGTRDLDFGVNGVVAAPYGPLPDYLTSLALLADGRVVGIVSSQSTNSSGPPYPFTLARFNTTGSTVTPAKADFNADGKGDILWRNTNGRTAAWIMNGTAYSTGTDIYPDGSLTATHLADFDGDGRSDFVWQHANGAAYVEVRYNLYPIYPAVQVLAPGSGWTITHVADVDGNGKPDFVLRHTDGSVALRTMNGTTQVASLVLLGPGSGWTVARTADFDGDGKDDLLWTHPDGRHAIWLLDGLALKAATQILNAGSGWTATHAPDLDGDGKADLLWQHTDGSIAVWLMNGATMANGLGILGGGSGWSVARTGDFNGDGKADLYFQHGDGRAAIWLMDGTLPIAQTQILNAGGGWTAMRLADMDGDGKADILWQHTDGRAAIWIMNGTLMTQSAEILAPGTGWSVVGFMP